MNEASVFSRPSQACCCCQRAFDNWSRIDISARFKRAELLAQFRIESLEALQQHLVIIARPAFTFFIDAAAPRVTRNPSTPWIVRFGGKWLRGMVDLRSRQSLIAPMETAWQRAHEQVHRLHSRARDNCIRPACPASIHDVKRLASRDSSECGRATRPALVKPHASPAHKLFRHREMYLPNPTLHPLHQIYGTSLHPHCVVMSMIAPASKDHLPGTPTDCSNVDAKQGFRTVRALSKLEAPLVSAAVSVILLNRYFGGSGAL